MIKVKLRELAKTIGKNISEISRETGINRNTLNALAHAKVGDVKFSTVERICQTYNLKLEDILEHTKEPSLQTKSTSRKLYKQEAEAVLFTCWPWIMAWGRYKKVGSNERLFDKMEVYLKKNYGAVYYDLHPLYAFGKHNYKKYAQKAKFDEAYNKFLMYCLEIEELYKGLWHFNVALMSEAELKRTFGILWRAYEGFWDSSLFIDSFDVGVDREEIGRVAKKHNLTAKEVEVLTTSSQMTFNNERKLAVLELAKGLARKKVAKAKLKAIKEFVGSSPAVRQYKINFDYYKSNYGKVQHIQDQEIIEELKKYLASPKLLREELAKLRGYGLIHQKRVKAILKKHKLKANPLWFFAGLTYWREHRKRVNLMGIHILDAILASVENKTGILKRYLGYLALDELDSVFKKLIDLDILKKRYEQGVLVTMQGKNYSLIEGKEATSVYNELEKKLAGHLADKSILPGQTACQGYVKGIARIILTQKDFPKLKKGEILVTGMTRPEFVPVMKRSAAIVTNEGGITCHAAIVSRELGKPCVIGTKNATRLIKDGSLIEVRANHGTVRILKQ